MLLCFQISPAASSYQRRNYRKFSRVPKEVIPADEDKGKLNIFDYTGITSQKVNNEVLREAAELKNTLKSRYNSNKVLTGNAYESEPSQHTSYTVLKSWKPRKNGKTIANT